MIEALGDCETEGEHRKSAKTSVTLSVKGCDRLPPVITEIKAEGTMKMCFLNSRKCFDNRKDKGIKREQWVFIINNEVIHYNKLI